MRASSALQNAPLFLFLASTALVSASTIDILDDGLIIQHTSGPVACDRPTRSHDEIAVHYNGTLQSDGSEFDSSYPLKTPFVFLLDAGRVIKGWDEGLLGMCIGQSRKLIIPPELGYGTAGAGPIPGGATLVFETKLVDIVQFSNEPDPVLNTNTGGGNTSISTSSSVPDGSIAEGEAGLKGQHGSWVTEPTDSISPMDAPPRQNECHLLGPFALFVQGALGTLAVLTLVWKRRREVPKRPWNIFFFDVSKQVFGSMLTHVINLAMSMLGSGDMADAAAAAASTVVASQGREGRDERLPNPCSFYLLNLGIDTTIGVPVLWFLLKLLHHLFLRTSLANPPESIESGHYGSPAKIPWYLKQLLIYCIGLIGMKLFVFFLFLTLPWLPWVGDWALRWTEGNEALQIAFALFIFPLIMNGIQYYVIDSFIMEKKNHEIQRYTVVEGHDDDDDDDDNDEEGPATPYDDGSVEENPQHKSPENRLEARMLKEIDPLPIPATNPSNPLWRGQHRGKNSQSHL